MTIKLEITRGGPPLFKVWIDGEQLQFGNGDTAETEVGRGTFAMNWIVIGEPGSNYSIEITSPDSLKFKHNATLDSSLKDAGLHWIEAL